MSTTTFLKVEVDEEMIEKLIISHVREKLEQISNQKIFWTMSDLEYLTSCSEGYIKDKFFYDSRFAMIRRKVGRKWLFPAEETEFFLLEWLKEQPNE